MSFAIKVARKLRHFYRLYIQKDPFTIAANQWFRAKGDETLRLNYPLKKSNVVVDVGGYRGDFAFAIHQKFSCTVLVFEPVPAFYEQCAARFHDNPSVQCYNFGIGSKSEKIPIYLSDDGSSTQTLMQKQSPATQLIEIKSIIDVYHELNLQQIDLLKINIEGGEYELLSALIDSGLIQHVRYLQVQFHNFFPDAPSQRNALRDKLSKTHREMWNYEFIWESWERLSP